MSPSIKILVIEDDEIVRQSLRFLLNSHQVFFFSHIEEYFARAKESNLADVELVLLDLRHSADPEGQLTIQKIPELRSRLPHAELIIQSGVSDVEAMRECIQKGASRFVLKEHLADEIPLLVERHMEVRAIRSQLDTDIVGSSFVLVQLKRDLLDLRFQRNLDVLVEGETGTGKELCARALHSGGPFIAVNMSAIPPELFEAEFFGSEKGAFSGSVQARVGHFEAAGNGILFLDEIQSISPAHQAKLLRVLETRAFTRVGSSQERPFRARIVSAANTKLKEAVARGLFREDLYYRLAPMTLHVPPLRVRGEDIVELAKKFLKDFDESRTKRFTDDALTFIQSGYDWPGNVRELRGLTRNLVARSPIPLLDSREIQKQLQSFEDRLEKSPELSRGHGDGHFKINWTMGFDRNVEELEKFILAETLKSKKSSEARDALQLSRSRFYEKVRQYGLLK